MEVFRIEHGVTGEGPYREQKGVIRALDDATGKNWREPSSNHPHPADEWGWDFVYEDLMKSHAFGHWHFGFKDLEQYLNWFYTPKVRSILKEYGFVLKVYKVGGWHVKKTVKQVIFKSAKAEVIRTLCPFTMEEM